MRALSLALMALLFAGCEEDELFDDEEVIGPAEDADDEFTDGDFGENELSGDHVRLPEGSNPRLLVTEPEADTDPQDHPDGWWGGAGGNRNTEEEEWDERWPVPQ
jgi:hypothetical protein